MAGAKGIISVHITDMKCLAGTVDGLRAARIDSDGRAHVFMEWPHGGG